MEGLIDAFVHKYPKRELDMYKNTLSVHNKRQK